MSTPLQSPGGIPQRPIDTVDFGATAAAPAPAAAAPLTAPTLTLEAAAPTPAVVATQAPRMAPQIEAAQVPALDQKVDAFLSAIHTAQAGSPEFSIQADAVRQMGDADIRKAAETSNRLLQKPVAAMREGGLAQSSHVGKTLLDLRRTVEDLDPSQAKGVKKILGMIPFGRDVQDYFRKYESSQDHLNGILHALRQGQDELQRDNASLTLEKQNLWETMGRLNQYLYIAERLDTRLAANIAELELSDPDKARTLNQDVLFYVRQKHQDLLTQLAVSIQSYLAIDVIIRNNIELIKGVDRASTTTVSALRTAVIVAQALGNQQLVLNQIQALNSTTSSMIQRTSEMLRDNSSNIQAQAANSTIGLDQLQAAFANIYQTMDSIDAFKTAALNNMSQTIGVLETEVSKSRSYLERVKYRESQQTPVDLALNDGSGPVTGPIGKPQAQA
ncbi:MAG: toxic anion resistance protein [Propionibacteriaceae bacterium]